MATKNKKARKAAKADRIGIMPEEDDAEAGLSGDEEPGDGEDGELQLEEVLKLGGTKSDYIFLAGLDDSNELVDGGKKGAIDDLEEGELEKFVTKLGIRAYSGLQVVVETPEKAPTAEQQSSEKKKKQVKVKKVEEASASEKKAQLSSGKKSKQNVFEFTPRQVLLVKPGGKWFELEYCDEGSAAPQDAALVASYKTLATQLLQAEVDLYRTKKNLQKGANSAWMKTVVSSGVLADRMAAMTVLIQDAPVHTLEHVESLVAMMKKKGNRRMGLMAMDTLRELLLSNLLPEQRKLRPFAEHPFHQLEEKASGNRDSRDRRLVLWLYEHRLKLLVAEFVQALDLMSHDTVPTTKTKALAAAHQLLCRRPEQERALLTQVVNKLGDPEYKTAAKASYLLETLLHQHPNMKAVVCNEVERLMFRPNVSAKAQYYAVCFLSQVMLSHDEAPLAAKLVSVYFSFFRSCVKKKDVESKMLSALLSGVNRAYPYAGEGDEKVKEQMDTLFRVVHLVKFNTAVQALMLLFQVMDSQQSVSDRYYVALYKKLLDPGLSSSSKQSMFLNLLYKSLKADVCVRRVKAFVKRLLQISAEQNSSFTCGALFLVSEVMRSKPSLKMLLQEGGDGEEEQFKDLPDDDDDDEEERFVDTDKLEEGKVEEEVKPSASWVHHQNLDGMKRVTSYDPLHRNPLFCGADHSTLWELQRLCHHFHPSVALFAQTVLKGDPVQYSGDPLQDFTLIRFLDRFVFRNPKQLKGKQNTDCAAMMSKHRLPLSSLPVNSEEFLSKDESQVPVDDLFFYRFFKKKRELEKPSRRRRRNSDEESVEEVDDDEFEKILDSVEGDSYFSDVLDDGLDFAGNVKSEKRKTKSPMDDSDSEDVEDLDDEEVSLGSLDEEDFGDELEEEGGTFMDADGDEEVPEEEEEEEEFEGSDDDDDDDDEEETPKVSLRSTKKRKSSEELDFSKGLGKKKKKKDTAMFASAEEFGSMLDDNTSSKFDNIGLNAMANTDKAGVKQLTWEAQRDDWIHGRDAKTLRRKKATMGRKRPSFANQKRRK